MTVAAKAQWRQVADQLRPRVPKLSTFMDEAEADVLAYMSFPKDHRTKIHSNNPIKRLNGEIKLRTEVVGMLASPALALQRSIGLQVGRRDLARTERRGGRPALPLHDGGKRRPFER